MSAILLCSYIGIQKEDVVKPLALSEWNLFLDKVIKMNMEPSIVLNKDLEILKSLAYSDNEIERIRKLVSRGGAVAFELNELKSKGINVITLFDADYPILMKRKLKRKTPPILFYAGDINLAKKIGIGVVGSRNVDENGIEFTKELVKKATEEKLVIYSGGAKGVDSISESTALLSGGAVVSFISDSLSSKIKKREVLANIIDGKLLLISDVKPDVGFSAARAMNRNKYIYAASYGTFVVSSDYKKGGTWNGAIENLKNNWTKEFVWKNNAYVGNIKLIENGAIPFLLNKEKIYDIITQEETKYVQMDIFNSSISKKEDNTDDIYNIAKGHIVEKIDLEIELNSAAEKFNIAKGQMKIWLKRLCDEGLLMLENGVYKKVI